MCFKKYQKKKKGENKNDLLLYHYKTCVKCNVTFKSDKHYTAHLYPCYLKEYK